MPAMTLGSWMKLSGSSMLRVSRRETLSGMAQGRRNCWTSICRGALWSSCRPISATCCKPGPWSLDKLASCSGFDLRPSDASGGRSGEAAIQNAAVCSVTNSWSPTFPFAARAVISQGLMSIGKKSVSLWFWLVISTHFPPHSSVVIYARN